MEMTKFNFRVEMSGNTCRQFAGPLGITLSNYLSESVVVVVERAHRQHNELLLITSRDQSLRPSGNHCQIETVMKNQCAVQTLCS